VLPAAGPDGAVGGKGAAGSGRVAGCDGLGFDALRRGCVVDECCSTTTRVEAKLEAWTTVRLVTVPTLRVTRAWRSARTTVIGAAVSTAGGARPGAELVSSRIPAGATAPSGDASIAGGDGINGMAGGGGRGIAGAAGIGGAAAGTKGAGASPTGNACCAAGRAVVALAAEEALDAATFVWVTSPSSPGLAIRIVTVMLQSMQIVGSEGAPFHVQFQSQVCGVVSDALLVVLFVF